MTDDDIEKMMAHIASGGRLVFGLDERCDMGEIVKWGIHPFRVIKECTFKEYVAAAPYWHHDHKKSDYYYEVEYAD